MKLKVFIFLLAAFSSVLGGGPSLISQSIPCADTVLRGQCFGEGSQLTSCNGNWIATFSNGKIRLSEISSGISRLIYSSSCTIVVCIDANGNLSITACGLTLFGFPGVGGGKLGDDGSLNLLDINGNVVFSRPPERWNIE